MSSRIAVTSTVSAGAAAGEAEAAVAGETADAAGLVAEGAVADSIVVFGVFGGVTSAGGVAAGCPNILDIRLLNIPIMRNHTLCRKKTPPLLGLIKAIRVRSGQILVRLEDYTTRSAA
jgi:hypothetical protein